MIKQLISKIWTKISRRAGKLARGYVLFVLHYFVFSIIALAGSKLNLKKQGSESEWREWNDGGHSPLITKQSGKSWVLSYVSWACKSKNTWTLFLLPFIIMLKITEDPSDPRTLESELMYTLF